MVPFSVEIGLAGVLGVLSCRSREYDMNGPRGSGVLAVVAAVVSLITAAFLDLSEPSLVKRERA
jgi:hypothetical protein